MNTQVDAGIDAGVDKFVQIYSALGKDNLLSLQELYHLDVVFEDPAHRVSGWDNLHAYFVRLFKSVTDCHFDIHETVQSDNTVYVQWTMTFSHPKVAGGAMRSVRGCSRLVFDEGKVIHHRDYFDLGEMIYEGIPLLGALIKKIKSGL